MEKKICTYSEPKHRLQLLKVDDGYEIRYNRKVVDRFLDDNYLYVRLMFTRYVNGICINRTSPFVLKITP